MKRQSSMARWVGLVVLATEVLAGCSSPKVETRAEMLQRALSDKNLSDSAAIMLIGQASFRKFKEAATLPPVDGKVVTVLIVQGTDTSKAAGLIKETDPRAVQQKLKNLEFVSLFKELDGFLENALKRNLGDLTLTLLVPSMPDPGPQDWTDAYQFDLPAKSFDRYLKTSGLETSARIAQAERIWKVKTDAFK